MELTFPTGEQAMVCVFVTMDGDQRLVAVTTSAGPDGPSMLLLKNNEDEPKVLVYRTREDCDAAFLAEADRSVAQGYEFICHVVVPIPPMIEADPFEPMFWEEPLTRPHATAPGRSGVQRWADRTLSIKHISLPWDERIL